MNQQVREIVKSVAVLVVLTIVCVAVLAVLNDLLYVAPDISKFASAYEAEYVVVDVADAQLSSGKVDVAAEGTDGDGNDVVGLYITANRAGKPEACVAVVVIDRTTDTIKGICVVKDGSTGSQYEHSQENFDKMIGKQITSADVFNAIDYIIQAGATETSKTFRNVYIAAAEYYYAVYMEGR